MTDVLKNMLVRGVEKLRVVIARPAPFGMDCLKWNNWELGIVLGAHEGGSARTSQR
jgi:hypothetical protein